jgi:hypothetical protein
MQSGDERAADLARDLRRQFVGNDAANVICLEQWRGAPALLGSQFIGRICHRVASRPRRGPCRLATDDCDILAQQALAADGVS